MSSLLSSDALLRRRWAGGILLSLIVWSTLAASEVAVEYFYQPGCNECRRVDALILPRLEERYSGRYRLAKYDIGVPENYLKLVAYQEKMAPADNSSVSMVLDGRIFLGGFEKIDSSLFDSMELATVDQSPEAADAKPDLLRRRGDTFTFWTVVFAGLADGINPCVFATLIFFATLLGTSGVRGKMLLAAGGVYCLACFLAYLALGFGLFRFLRLLSAWETARNVLDILLIAVLLGLALFSFRDALRFRRSGMAKDVTLQLPGRVKRWIHETMKRGLKYRYLIPGMFLIGVFVTLLESVCTGQVYVPTLALLSREYGAGSRYFGLLLLYNFMFILPLLFIFYAAWKGTATATFLRWSRKNAVWSKIALGCFFLLLAGVLIFV